MPNLSTHRRLANLFHASHGAVLAYELLSRHASLTASQAAVRLGKSRSRAYEILRELVEKGLAIEEPGRPARFRVGDARVALASLKEDLDDQAAAVAQALRFAGAMPTARQEPVEPRVAFFYGAPAVEREAARIARKAKNELVFYCADDANRLPKSGPLQTGLRKAIRRGVLVRVYATPGPETANLISDLSVSPGNSFQGKVVEGLAPFSCIASENQALFPLPSPPTRGRGVHAMRIDGSGIAQFTIRALDHVVNDAEAEGQSVDSVEEFVPRYAKALDRAQAEVSNIGGAGVSRFLRPPYYRILQAHSELAANRGVKLRAIMNDGPEELAFLRRYGTSKDWEVRTASWIPVWTSVIDRKQVFQALLGPTGGHMFRWSQGEAEVELNARLFESTWGSASPFTESVDQLSDETESSVATTNFPKSSQ